MKVLFSSDAWTDYLYWVQSDLKLLVRLNELIENIRRQPFAGLGKPEALKGDLSGWWSRRITGEHRLIYRVTGSGDVQRLEIIQCRYHY